MDKTYNQAEFNQAVHNAIESAMTGQTLRSNAASDASIRNRLASALSGGYDFADTLHNIYQDYGYPATLTFFNFWNMYRRFGIAQRIVEIYPEQTWLDGPTVNANPQFEKDLDVLIEQRGLWRRLKGLDTRQRVGRYAGLFMRVRDNLSPELPIAGKLQGVDALMDMVPMYEGQLKVLTTQDDPKHDDYGQPTMYQFNSGAVGSRDEKSATSFNIHPSRIIIAAEGADNGGIYGIPSLESVYNSLMDLRKILGGGGEGFYKNAAQSIVFDVKDAANAAGNKTLLDTFNDQYDDFSQNRSRRAMWTPGMEAKTLDSTLIEPEGFARNSLMDISSGGKVPMTLLTGNQTGRLAGDQDSKGFLVQVQARREDFGTEMITNTLDWCITWGVLPSSEYEVEWPDALAPSDDEKLSNAERLSNINEKVFRSGGNVPFESEEIREAAGYEPEDMPEIDDSDSDESLEDDEQEDEDRPDRTGDGA